MDFRQAYLPYCIQKVGNKTWVFLNRAYKPTGQTSSKFVDYRNFAVICKITKPMLKNLITVPHKPDAYWFYDDTCIPTKSAKDFDQYMKRLKPFLQVAVSMDD